MESASSTPEELEKDSSNTNKSAAHSWLMLRVHVVLILVQLAYAGSYVLNRVALVNGVNPIVFAVYRDSVCMLILAPIAFFFERRKAPRLTPKLVGLLVASGFFGAYLTQMLLLFGVSYTSAAYASTISILTPLFTFIIAAVFRLEQIRWKKLDGQVKVGGLICAFCGAVVLGVYMGPVILGRGGGMVDPPMSDLDPSRSILEVLPRYLGMGRFQLGISLLFLAGLFLSITISIQVPILELFPSPISVSVTTYFLGAVMLFITAASTVSDWSEFVVTEKFAVISYVYNGVAPAAFSFTMLIWSVKRAGPVLPAAYTPLQLFASYTMAYVFLGEVIHLGSVIGALLIISGLGFISWGQIKNRTEAVLPLKAVPPLEAVTAGTAIAAGVEEPLLG